eukprot:TRINITY_DN2618_c0_g1_i1.p1 TRINITY_DN2618_c0_g1~~TRINITY_DN2618_c0_g1_i1.p1  ORF type:complete len:307 (-),score=100.78 TRINITY_DN2618_c0_g1_i1:196-1116(-)
MAMRDRTDEYCRIRQRATEHLSFLPGGDTHEMTSFLSVEEGGETVTSPVFVEVMQEAKEDMNRIRERMQEIATLQRDSVKVTFDSSDEEDTNSKIEILTSETRGLFKKCESKIKAIGAPPVLGVKRSAEEQQMRSNIQKNLAIQLQDLTQQFRSEQRSHLQRVKQQQDRRGGFSVLGEDEESAEQAERRRELERRMMDPGFTDEQMAYLLLHEDIVSEREQGIDEILQAITELSEMFRDLNQMVIEQGTVLDRIDYNLEQAEKFTGGAVKELDKASEYQRKARMKLCILLLMIGCGTMGVALFLTK